MGDVPAGTGMETGTAVESSVLLQRLERRRTESLGVIDVRWPQAHYARTAGWIAQRFPLLQQLAVRYGGGDEGQTGSDLVYRTAEAFPSKLLSASTLEKTLPPAAGVSPSVSTIPPATLRVSRRPPSLTAKPAPAAVPVLSSTPEGGRPVGGEPQSRETVTSLPPPSLQISNRVIARQVTGTPMQGTSKLETGVSTVQDDGHKRQGQPTDHSPPLKREGQGGFRGYGDATPVGNSPMVPADWQRSPGESPTLTTAKPELKRVKPVPLAASQPATQLLLRASSAAPAVVAPAQPPASSGREVPTLQPAAAPQPRITSTLTFSPLTLSPQGGGNEPAVQLQRQPDDTQASALPATAAAVGTVDSHTPPVVMEIRDNSTFGQESGMIWRKSANAPVASETGRGGMGGMGGSARATLPLTLNPAGNSALPVARQAITNTLTLSPQGGGNEPAQLQRQPDDAQTGTVDSLSPPVVMEIRDNSTFGQESGMIWRKSTNALVTGEAGGAGMGGSARATLPLTLKSAGNSALPVARQAITNATVPASSPANTQSLLPLSQANEPYPAGIDWEQLIEQVGRHILRQLTIARERRGLKGWN